MGRNTYNGGGLIVHGGSGFFSHRGGPGRNRKPRDGEDVPGPALKGSICDFSSLLSHQNGEQGVSVRDKGSTGTSSHHGEQEHLKISKLISLARAEISKNVVRSRTHLLKIEGEWRELTEIYAAKAVAWKEKSGKPSFIKRLASDLNTYRLIHGRCEGALASINALERRSRQGGMSLKSVEDEVHRIKLLVRSCGGSKRLSQRAKRRMMT